MNPDGNYEQTVMQNSILLIFIVFIYSPLYTLGQNYDSLFQTYLSLSDDTTKVNMLNDLAYQIRKNDTELAIRIATEANAISRKLEFIPGEIKSERTLGIAHGYGTDKDLALIHYQNGLKIARENGFTANESRILNNIGNLYFVSGKYENALKYYSESLEIRRKNNDLKGMASTLGNMGNIANAKMKDLDLALKYYSESLEISKKINDHDIESTTLNNLGNIYASRRNYAKALEAQKAALKIDDERGDLYGMTYAQSAIANIYMNIKMYDSALFYAINLNILADSLNSLSRKKTAYIRLANIYEAKAEYKKALEYRVKYQVVSDSLRNSRTEVRIAELESQYQNQLKTKEVNMLRSENEINLEKLKNRQNERIIWLLLSIILLGGIGLLWIQLKKVRQYSKQLNAQKDDISTKSQEIIRINQIIQKRNQKLNETLTELRQTRVKLLESEKIASISVLISGLAHELNNPLNYVSGLIKPITLDLEELSKSVEEQNPTEAKFLIEEMNQLLSSLSVGVKKVSDIVKNVVDISPKIYPEQMKAIDLAKILEASINVIQSDNPDVEITFEAEEDIVVYGDFAEFNKVFLNILTNSIDALSDHAFPRVTVRINHSDEYGVVNIKDNGVGMTTETLMNIYQPFYTTKEPGSGTGLGMFISYAIIKKYKGDISVDSEIDVGTEFTIKLPLSNQSVIHK